MRSVLFDPCKEDTFINIIEECKASIEATDYPNWVMDMMVQLPKTGRDRSEEALKSISVVSDRCYLDRPAGRFALTSISWCDDSILCFSSELVVDQPLEPYRAVGRTPLRWRCWEVYRSQRMPAVECYFIQIALTPEAISQRSSRLIAWIQNIHKLLTFGQVAVSNSDIACFISVLREAIIALHITHFRQVSREQLCFEALEKHYLPRT